MGGGRLRMEIRTVNHRLLQPRRQAARRSGGLEGELRERLRREFDRGHVALRPGGSEAPATDRRGSPSTSSGRALVVGAAPGAADDAGPGGRCDARAGGPPARCASIGATEATPAACLGGGRAGRGARPAAECRAMRRARRRRARRRAGAPASSCSSSRAPHRGAGRPSGWSARARPAARGGRRAARRAPGGRGAAGAGDRLPGRPARHHRGAGPASRAHLAAVPRGAGRRRAGRASSSASWRRNSAARSTRWAPRRTTRRSRSEVIAMKGELEKFREQLENLE